MNILRVIAVCLVIACVPVLSRAQTQRPRPSPATTQLQMVNPAVSQFEDGPPLGSLKLVPGETAFFRFGAVNFKTGEEGKVELLAHVQIFDPRGTAILPVDEIPIGTSLREEDKDWKPILRSQFQVPGIAPPGTYKIRYDVTDRQTNQKASGETTFEVDGRNVPASPRLVIHGIGFYRAGEDEKPLGVAAYRPGDSVWVRFDATGFKYGDQNSIDVAYDVAVTAPDGKQLFAQENAAVEKSQAFYPQPWVPGSFSLTLQPNMNPGTYTIVITARDAVGNQTAIEKAAFKVE